MAKGPGPALFLAAAAAFLLMGRKKDEPAVVGDGTATGSANSDSDEDVGGGPVGGGSGGGGGSSQSGNPPPNVSGDSAGYSTTLYPGPLPVRVGLISIGYDVGLNDQPVGSEDVSNPHAAAFQAHYNQASSTGFHGAQGELEMDGWMGPNSLNALEIILQYNKDGGEDDWAAMNP